MKKIASLFLLVLVTISCSTDVTKNNPAYEGLKDDVRWRAKVMYAELTPDQHLHIIGQTAFQTLTLTTSNTIGMDYIIGENYGITATFVDTQAGITYSTGTGIGDGVITLTEYDPVKMVCSGTFRFNAINTENNPAGGPILNFQHGQFYKVPVVPAQ